MKVTLVQYELLVPLRQYENVKLVLGAVPDAGDDSDQVFAALRARVLGWADDERARVFGPPPPQVTDAPPPAYDPGPAPDNDAEIDAAFLTHERNQFRHLAARARKNDSQTIAFFRSVVQNPQARIEQADGPTLGRVNEALQPLATAVAEIGECCRQLDQDVNTLVASWATTQHTPDQLGSFSLTQAQALAAVLRAEVEHPGSAANILPPPSATPEPPPLPPRTTGAPQAGDPRPQAGPGPVSEKQLAAIYAIAKSALRMSQAEVNAECQERYECKPSELTKIQASEFIDALKAGAAS